MELILFIEMLVYTPNACFHVVWWTWSVVSRYRVCWQGAETAGSLRLLRLRDWKSGETRAEYSQSVWREEMIPFSVRGTMSRR